MAETATETRTAQKPPAPGPDNRPSWRESVESLLVTIILALFATCFVVQAFKIPSGSMEPTLLIGDHVLVNKFLFEGNGAWYDRVLPYRPIRHGDVVVFKCPCEASHPHFVKRVIGLPGDRIKIVNSAVFVNGKQINEPYVIHNPSTYDPFAENFPPTNQDYVDAAVLPRWKAALPGHVNAKGQLVVPPHEYFVMGDNRDESWDSRYWGFVPRDAIVGRPVIIYWSLKQSEQVALDQTTNPGSWLVDVFHTILRIPSDTRWSRMFKEVH